MHFVRGSSLVIDDIRPRNMRDPIPLMVLTNSLSSLAFWKHQLRVGTDAIPPGSRSDVLRVGGERQAKRQERTTG